MSVITFTIGCRSFTCLKVVVYSLAEKLSVPLLVNSKSLQQDFLGALKKGVVLCEALQQLFEGLLIFTETNFLPQ